MTPLEQPQSQSPPRQPAPGPQDPLAVTPARVPGSVRRTSSLDSSRPDGAGGPLVIDARARDVVTGPDGEVVRSSLVVLRLTLDDTSREIRAVTCSPDVVPGIDRLVGKAVVAGFRRVLGEVLPDERRSRSLAHLLLDDLPGATLVSGYGLMRSGQLDLVDRPRMAGAAIAGGMADLCAGWAADGAMLQATRATGVVPTPYGPPAPVIENPDDPLSWHETAPLLPHATRRRRRLDLGPALGPGPAGAAGRHPVDVHFRDTYNGDDGETVVHEYTASATVDAAADRLVALSPRAQVLPWQECPGALVSASRLVGSSLDDLALTVRRDLVGTTSCTHLNDTFRSLADLTALLPLLRPGN
jgi:hypothetical protein